MKYSSKNEAHCAAAARWLATLHTTATDLAANLALQDRGPKYYLDHLRSACNKILLNLTNPALNSRNIAILEAILVHCEILQSHWYRIEEFCDELPHTLVHGDFNSKNKRVRFSNAGVTFLALDWETGGWAAPAADLSFLSKLDFSTYWSIVREYWPSIDIQTLQTLTNLGRIFRAFAAIDWASGGLSHNSNWVQRIMVNMKMYDSHLTEATRAVGWEI
jgi:aminoglycoside phosphotransferase (APT) family kinase protein